MALDKASNRAGEHKYMPIVRNQNSKGGKCKKDGEMEKLEYLFY